MLAGAAQRQRSARPPSGVANKQPAADARQSSDRPWLSRAASAVGRRALAAWQRMTAEAGSTSLAAAVDWFLSSGHQAGMPLTPGETPCPTLTAGAIPTLLALGEVDLARCWAELLAARFQLASRRGNSVGRSPFGASCGSLTATGAALGAWLALADAQLADTLPLAAGAADWLAAHIDDRGAFNLAGQSQASVDWWGAPAVHVGWLPSLRIAARQLGEPAWQAAAERAANHARRGLDWSWWSGAAQVTAGAMAAWLDWGDSDFVRHAMHWPAAAQRRDGGVPDRPGSQAIDGAAQALFACVWYRLGDRERANRALAFLRARQLPSGGFPARWQGRFHRSSPGTSACVAKLFIDASLLEATTAFDTAADLPTEIDPADGRLTAAHQWFTSLGPSPVVVDVGCGPGRFLRELGRRFPAARLVGIDPAPRYLDMLPETVEGRRGALPRLPARDGEFDAALAIESLEHSLLPERAIAELCRIVRPGGRLLIIDKHRARQALSICERWEEWFLPETVAGWLKRHCRDVRVRPIAHGGDGQPSGLFLCWEATRR